MSNGEWVQLDLSGGGWPGYNGIKTFQVYSLGNSKFNTEKYIQDTNHSNVASNVSNNINVTNISDLVDFDVNTKVKNKINIDYTTPHQSSNYENYHSTEKDIILSRNLPEHSSHTNI